MAVREVQIRIFSALSPVFIAALFLFGNPAYAQKSDVSAKLETDTNKMLIGEQIRAIFSIEHLKSIELRRPVILDTLADFEVISAGKIDTLTGDSPDHLRTEQELILTNFDSGYYVIPPVKILYLDGSDTAFAETEALLIEVYTVPVDTTKAIKDIRANIELPWGWRDFLPYVLAILLLAALILAIWFIYKRYFRRTETVTIKKPLRPAHELALEALEKLKQEKIWQQGEVKLYYTKLSDIIREYLKNRYGINAPEMTTDELLVSPTAHILDASVRDDLQQLLQLADLVKFAKSKPGPSDNESAFAKAIDIIEKTKLIIEKVEPEIPAEEKS